MSYGVKTVVGGFPRDLTESEYIPTLIARTVRERAELTAMVKKAIASGVTPLDLAVEFGCGYGRMTSVLCDFSKKVIGFERDRELFGLARDVWTKEELSFVNVEALSRTNLDDASVDLAVTFTVLQHMTDSELRDTADELFRVVRPGGYLVTVEETSPKLRGPGTWGRSAVQYEQFLQGFWLVYRTPRLVEMGGDGGEYLVWRRNK